MEAKTAKQNEQEFFQAKHGWAMQSLGMFWFREI